MKDKRDPDLHKGHRERMKKRMLNSDLYDFQEHEILEMLLFYAIPRGDTNELAHRLINECGGSIYNVFNSSFSSLTSVKGVSAHTASFLKMIPRISAYYACSGVRGSKGFSINDTEKLSRYFEALFSSSIKEEVYFAGVTDELIMERPKLIYRGTLSSALLNTGSFLNFVSDYGYSRLIMAHNHPHGTCIPSKKDIKLTKYMVESLARMGISLEDHIIVGTNGSMSMRSSRLVNQIWQERSSDADFGDDEFDIW